MGLLLNFAFSATVLNLKLLTVMKVELFVKAELPSFKNRICSMLYLGEI